MNISYVLRVPDFNEPKGLRVCSVQNAVRALRGWVEGLLKSGISREYGVHNMFSANSSIYEHSRVSKHREFERDERTRPSHRAGLLKAKC